MNLNLPVTCNVFVGDLVSEIEPIDENVLVHNAANKLGKNGFSQTVLARSGRLTRSYVRLDQLLQSDKQLKVKEAAHQIEARHMIRPNHDPLEIVPRLQSNLKYGDKFLLCFEGEKLKGIVTVSDINTHEFMISLYPLIASLERVSRELTIKIGNWKTRFEEQDRAAYVNAKSHYERADKIDNQLDFSNYLSLVDKLNLLRRNGFERIFPVGLNVEELIDSIKTIRNSVAHPQDLLPKGARDLPEFAETLSALTVIQKNIVRKISS